ncbi:MAG: DUF362 domain-containing protein [Chloroflexi bacterium]|nr:DUF362 domain-containing protein [Chloroflexota bacterium]
MDLESIADQVMLDNVRRILIKPNFVSTDCQLAATHVDAVRAEGAALFSTREGYCNFGYESLIEEYGVDLIDLSSDDTVPVQIFCRRLCPMTTHLTHAVVEVDYRI